MNMQRILYIEDNMLNVQLVQKCLENSPYQLIAAQYGEEGIQFAATHQPHLVMVDLNLPDMTGFDVIAHLHQLPGMGNIPIIILTADSSEKSMRRVESLGCEGYLTKPVSRRLLLRKLDSFLLPVAIAL